MSVPTGILCFAQSRELDLLTALNTEREGITAGLKQLTDNGAIALSIQPATSLADLSQVISAAGDKLTMLHFGGHAEQQQLHLTDGQAQSEGIVTQLMAAARLKLIFLNGCSTYQQVEAFLQLPGVAIIATVCPVADGEASYFATRFYEALGLRRSVTEAYQIAVGAMQTRWVKYTATPNTPVAVPRGFLLNRRAPNPEVPWRLFYDPEKPEVLQWRIAYPTLNTVPLCRPGLECIGREAELEQIGRQLKQKGEPLVVRGVGGAGKSTIAKAWATANRLQYDNLIWLSGDNLFSAFVQDERLGAALQLRSMRNGENAESYLFYALGRLRGLAGNNLIILDDLSRDMLVRNLVDRPLWQHLTFPEHWDVLLTTREQLPFYREYVLGSMREVSATTLFSTYFTAAYQPAELAALLREIDYHPLTIELLAKTLGAMSGLIDLGQVLENIRAFQLDKAELQEPVYTPYAGREAGVFQQLCFAFELVDLSDEQQALLRQRALLPAESMLIEELADLLEQQPLFLNRSLNDLAKRGWVTKNEASFAMHRMIQDIVLYQCKPEQPETDRLRNRLAGRLQSGKPHTGAPVYWSLTSLPLARWLATRPVLDENDGLWMNKLFDVLQEPIFLANVRFLLEQLLPRAERQSKEAYIFEVLTYIYRNYLALAYKTEGAYSEALNLAKKNLTYVSLRFSNQLIAKLLSREADDTINWELERIQAYSLIVRIHVAAGELGAALAENRKMLDHVSQHMPEHRADPRIPIIVATLTDLVQILEAGGYFQNALELCESALSFMPDNVSFAFFKAKSLGGLGRFEEAVPVFEEVISRRSEFTTTHSYLNAIEHYAVLLYEHRQLEKSFALFSLLLEERPKILPADHPEIAQTRMFLAIIHYRQGNLPAAKQLLYKVAKTLPEQHPKYIEASFTLALVLQTGGELAASNDQLAQLIVQLRDIDPQNNLITSCWLYRIENDLRLGQSAQAAQSIANLTSHLAAKGISLTPDEQSRLENYQNELRLLAP